VQRLNADKVPAFGNSHGWYTSSIAKILGNRAVLGEFQLHRLVGNKRVPVGDPVPNYFPPIIDESLFYKAKTSRKQRLNGNHPRGGRRGKNFPNIFSGIARCAYCNGPMRHEDKGAMGRSTYLVCSNARRGRKDICTEKTSWLYPEFETSFLAFVSELDLASIMSSDANARLRADLQDEITVLEAKRSSIADKQAAAFELLQTSNIEFVGRQLTDLQTQHQELVATIKQKAEELASFTSNASAYHEMKDLIAELQSKEGDAYKLRAEVASKLKSLISTLYIAPVGSRPLITKAKEIVGDEDPEDFDQVIRFLLEMPVDAHGRYFSVKFKDGNLRVVAPNPTNPLDYDSQVSTADLEHGTMPINIEEFHALLEDQ